MISRCDLPDQITLPSGAVLKPLIGGHVDGKWFFEHECSNGWFMRFYDGRKSLEYKAAIALCKKRKLKYRFVSVLSRRLRGKQDIHGRNYSGNTWMFIEVKP